jgi:hypothetical protein
VESATITTYEPVVDVGSAGLEPLAYGVSPGDPLGAILADYSDKLGMVRIVVLRSHDGLYEGEIRKLPNCQRTAGLIEAGFIDVVVDTPVWPGEKP